MGNVKTIKQSQAAACSCLVSGTQLKGWEKYFSDESRQCGTADAIALPTTAAEVAGALSWAREHCCPVTLSGARTGITAGAVPDGGLLLSLERMTHAGELRQAETGTAFVRCEAGVTLGSLQKSLAKTAWFYPPDPTETGAALGGTVACNASGAHTFGYGPTRPYVEAMHVVLAEGFELDLRRGEWLADEDGRFGMQLPSGEIRWGRMPTYAWPRTKNAAGYFSNGRDVMDLFIGSEGTLGIITDVELRLVLRPERSVMAMCFWSDEKTALAFVHKLRGQRQNLGLEAVEYFGADAMQMLRERRDSLGAASGVPACLEDDMRYGVFLDIGCAADKELETLNCLRGIVAQLGGDPEKCWCAVDADTRERLRVFRHALPETVNGLIAQIRRQYPTVTKLGTDMAVPDDKLEDYVAMFREVLGKAGLRYVTFGHIGDNHLHVNILPRNPEEYALGKSLYFQLAQRVVSMDGSPAAEHGIGKLKANFLELLVGKDGLREMQEIKKLFDPGWMLGRKTLLAVSPDSCSNC